MIMLKLIQYEVTFPLTVENALNVVNDMINNDQKMKHNSSFYLINNDVLKPLLNPSNLVLFMNCDNYNTLVRALRKASYSHTNIGQGGEFYYPGTPMKIVAAKSLSSTQMLLFDDEFIYSTGLESDLVLSSVKQYIRDQKLNKLLNDNS